MEDPKLRVERLKNALGNANSKVNVLKQINISLEEKNSKLIIQLKKTNELLAKAQELVDGKKANWEELDTPLNELETKINELQGELDELKTINDRLELQVEELKTHSDSIYTKALALVGIFAAGAWVVVGIRTFIDAIRTRTT